ncbi:cytochrome c-type biogenesis protein CcsB [Methylohalomonas lacus]|uniref:Cytochrome c-type biogenesis protein CcsB n=1 Tax=Methylohalomonas lacus TaxID=398773 RepID=A0AAE3L0R4_9GAMM|nr:c-type cytochrome biogenesis protein CcsB [Methylohalomonas lacus]MCS3902051.1 cytochrome c-type biogenesis protein CcsB [Methylohalomonas lacus]
MTSAVNSLSNPSYAGGRAGFLAWAVAVLAAAGYALFSLQPLMNGYEVIILLLAAAGTLWLGHAWPSFRGLTLAVAVLTLVGLQQYGDQLANADTRFLLVYVLASQSAIMWMSALFILATPTYFAALLARSPFTGQVASGLTWSAVAMGLTGLLVRWRETYLVGADIGYIPISNLYEVFVLFCLITALIYLFYERRFQTRALGGFAMLVISAAVGFLLWYSHSRGAHVIEPLVPALQSYWMKIHVPANFIGYGCFSLAAMIGVAALLRYRAAPAGRLAQLLPEPALLEEFMYRAIALGFAFFTLATILGSLWAAEAWGGYWSWDPKETWALIVWLNYAAWLHMRMTKGWRGPAMAWWAIVGLFVTLFAFLGVNMFLSGLHSYGEL